MLLQVVRDFFLQQSITVEKTCWIAYSGGLDSHVLLALCHELSQTYPMKLCAVHVNHHLSPQADYWSRHCEKVCFNYQIDFLEKKVRLAPVSGSSLEASAREKRYTAFADCLQEGDWLLTAHQQNDQAETILLQLLRGAGPKGLAAMPATKAFARGFHGRPLLTISRVALQQYAEDNGLRWIEDESNTNVRLTRNFIRHDILPLLATRWPTVSRTMARSATHCAESQALLEEFALTLLKDMKRSSDRILPIHPMLSWSQARQKLILRTWITHCGFPLPDTKKMDVILNDVLLAARDRLPCVIWGAVALRRYQEELYLLPLIEKPDLAFNGSWSISQPLTIPGVGQLVARRVRGAGLRIDIASVSVRFRQGGEVIALSGRGHRTLKHLLQEWRIPPWERNRLPLLFVDERCVGVVGYFIDAAYTVKQDEIGYVPHLDLLYGY